MELLSIIIVMTAFGCAVMWASARQARHEALQERDSQWREWLHSDIYNPIAPDGRDFSGRPAKRRAE